MNWYPADAYGELSSDISAVLITAEELHVRVQELGQELSRDYVGMTPLLVGVLKGVLTFLADLERAIVIPIEIDCIAVSHYTSVGRGKGAVRILKDLEGSIRGRHVIFVEDVIDTGLTANYLLRGLRSRDPASLSVCVLFNKPHHRIIDVPMKYKGFDLPDRFVVGYGLDYRERYRNLPFVGLLEPAVLQGNSSE
ncbi:MAG: hypoxanthine phosphoribosyltransferase [Anaerolineae bacterium]|nr:hypoxanthine phosphoribosyltransferase [Anaerolineae bacterium]